MRIEIMICSQSTWYISRCRFPQNLSYFDGGSWWNLNILIFSEPFVTINVRFSSQELLRAASSPKLDIDCRCIHYSEGETQTYYLLKSNFLTPSHIEKVTATRVKVTSRDTASLSKGFTTCGRKGRRLNDLSDLSGTVRNELKLFN